MTRRIGFAAMILGFANLAYGQNIGSKDVNVVNTPNVNVVNLPTVGIDPSNNVVRLTNTQSDPVPVSIAGATARRPFQFGLNLHISPGGNADFVRVQIPAGKRLVVEDVSAVTFQPQGQGLLVNYTTGLNDLISVDGQDEFEVHNLVLVSQGIFNGLERSVAHEKTLVFAEEVNGLGLIVNFSRGTMTGSAGARVTFSGYVEDLPATPGLR